MARPSAATAAVLILQTSLGIILRQEIICCSEGPILISVRIQVAGSIPSHIEDSAGECSNAIAGVGLLRAKLPRPYLRDVAAALRELGGEDIRPSGP